MQHSMARWMGLTVILLVSLGGCQLWPFMSDEDGRRPMAMGKDDQIMYPYDTQPVHLSEDFGDSYRAVKNNQILYPEASNNLEPVTDMDGREVQKAMKRYQKSFEKPPFEGKYGGGSKK